MLVQVGSFIFMVINMSNEGIIIFLIIYGVLLWIEWDKGKKD